MIWHSCFYAPFFIPWFLWFPSSTEPASPTVFTERTNTPSIPTGAEMRSVHSACRNAPPNPHIAKKCYFTGSQTCSLQEITHCPTQLSGACRSRCSDGISGLALLWYTTSSPPRVSSASQSPWETALLTLKRLQLTTQINYKFKKCKHGSRRASSENICIFVQTSHETADICVCSGDVIAAKPVEYLAATTDLGVNFHQGFLRCYLSARKAAFQPPAEEAQRLQRDAKSAQKVFLSSLVILQITPTVFPRLSAPCARSADLTQLNLSFVVWITRINIVGLSDLARCQVRSWAMFAD